MTDQNDAFQRENLMGNRSGRNGHNQGNNAQERDFMEAENDEKVDHLAVQIAELKQLTTNIHGEVVNQNTYLDGMGRQFNNTEGLLGGTMNRMGEMMATGGSSHMCMLVLFIVLVFIALYYIIRGY